MQHVPLVSREHLSGKSNAFGLLFLGRGNSNWLILLQSLYIVFSLKIRNSESQNCLDTMGHKSGEKVGSSYCHGLGGE